MIPLPTEVKTSVTGLMMASLNFPALINSDETEKILVDDDTSSVVEGRWRRLNTLGHYKVTLQRKSTNNKCFYN